MNKPKLLLIGPFPPPFSGPELSTKQLLESNELSDKFTVIFLNTNVRKDNSSKGKVDLVAFFASITFIGRLLWFLLFKRPAVAYHLITPSQIGWLGRDIWFILFTWIFGIKSIIHFRGSHLKLNMKNFNSVFLRIIKRLCRTVDIAIVQSNSLKDQFSGLIQPNRIKVVPNMIDNEFFDIEIEKKNNLKVLFLGHLTKAKGYTDILKSIPAVAEKFPNVEFHFCGNIRARSPMVIYNQITGEKFSDENAIDLQNEFLKSSYSKNHFYNGIVSGDKKSKFLAQATVFILPSYSEGFSRSILEAMAIGVPVITTPVGANKDFIKNDFNGLLVQPGDINDLSYRINLLLSDVELREFISKNAREMVINEFSETVVLKKYIQVFESCITKENL